MRFSTALVTLLTSAAMASAALGCGSATDETATDNEALAEGDVGEDSSRLTIIAEPSDKGAALIDAIDAAKTSLHLTMYLLTDTAVEDALIARHAAGVEVKVVLNETFPFGSNANTTSYNKLTAAGVSVVWSSTSFSFTHEKCLVVDGKTAWIMTANASASAYTKNREYLAVDTAPADVAEAEAIFAADFAHQAITPTGNLLVSPVSMRGGITTLIGAAKKTLDFEVEELGDTGITSALCGAESRGVKVRGVLAKMSESALEKKAVTALDACGVTLEMLSSPYIHAKAIVIDDVQMYVGSANFSETSLDHNRELGFVTKDSAAITTVVSKLTADIAAGSRI